MLHERTRSIGTDCRAALAEADRCWVLPGAAAHQFGPTEELTGAVEFVSGGCHRNRNRTRSPNKQMTQRGSGIRLRVDVSTNDVGKIDVELN